MLTTAGHISYMIHLNLPSLFVCGMVARCTSFLFAKIAVRASAAASGWGLPAAMLGCFGHPLLALRTGDAFMIVQVSSHLVIKVGHHSQAITYYQSECRMIIMLVATR